MLSHTGPSSFPVLLQLPVGSWGPCLRDNAQLSCEKLPGLCFEVLHQPSRMACWASRQCAKEQRTWLRAGLQPVSWAVLHSMSLLVE